MATQKETPQELRGVGHFILAQDLLGKVDGRRFFAAPQIRARFVDA
jgi:hypothetical protein